MTRLLRVEGCQPHVCAVPVPAAEHGRVRAVHDLAGDQRVQISLYDSSNGRTFEYVGTENYRRILDDDTVLRPRPVGTGVVRNTLVFVVLYVFVVTILSTILALMLNAQRRGKRPASRGVLPAGRDLPGRRRPDLELDVQHGRTAWSTPLLEDVGIGPPGGCSTRSWRWSSSSSSAVWTHVGFYAMILLAGPAGHRPAHLYEAARIDGATTWQRFRQITLPLLRPTTMVVVVLSTIARLPGVRLHLHAHRRRSGRRHDADRAVHLRAGVPVADPVRPGQRGRA